MACWVHKDSILNNDGVIQSLKEAWEIDLQGLERQYWLGTEAKRLGCYDFPGETWAGDGSAHKGGMGSGRESVLFISTQFSILYTFMYSPA